MTTKILTFQNLLKGLYVIAPADFTRVMQYKTPAQQLQLILRDIYKAFHVDLGAQFDYSGFLAQTIVRDALSILPISQVIKDTMLWRAVVVLAVAQQNCDIIPYLRQYNNPRSAFCRKLWTFAMLMLNINITKTKSATSKSLVVKQKDMATKG